MKKNKQFLAMLLAVMLLFGMTPNALAASKKPTPGKVTLTKISAPDYNRIQVQWKKTSNATHYKIYYKKSGTGKWISLATVSGNASSYTHVSSKSKPINVGQKYTYTVRGYNSKYKTNGSYDSRGLTTQTKPSKVKLNRAILASDKRSVTLSWNRTSGCSHYFVYRKTPSTGWKRIASLRAPQTTYTDRSPVKGQKNIYTVRGYYSPAKVLGNYDSKGLTVNVPKSASSQKPQKLTPGTVALSKISAPAYNKINIQWKKTSNATHYKIYYKKTGTKSWSELATVSGTSTSYTHTASKSSPITVGQSYTYTVKGYNSKYKTNGRYDSRGLTTKTGLAAVTLKGAALSGDKKSVRISWNPIPGCNQYLVYHKTPSTGWKRIATLKTNVTSYTHHGPAAGTKNIYTVRGYYTSTKTFGGYSTSGCSVFVPKPEENKPKPDTKPKYTYDLKIINTYDEFYNTTSTFPFFYIKTNNPNGTSIQLNWSPDPGMLVEEVLSPGFYRDVKGTRVVNMLKVEGGYLCRLGTETPGTYQVRVRETKPQYLDDYLSIDSSLHYCYETTASITVTIKDYRKTQREWIDGLIKKYTKPGMTPKERYKAVIYGEFVNGSRYRYPTIIQGERGYAPMLKEEGAIWQNHQLNSSTSPALLYVIGDIMNYPVKGVTSDISQPNHDAVIGPDGTYYSICPGSYTGVINKEDIEYIDFSKY